MYLSEESHNQSVPRDRNDEFEPKIVPKCQKDVPAIEEKAILLYGRGMSIWDIHDQLQDLYDIAMSAKMVNKITDKILPRRFGNDSPGP